MKTKIVLFLMAILPFLSINATAGIGENTCFISVSDYGAKGDGIRLNTKSINSAIAAAVAKGGGTVYFPAGNYVTGSIHLQSNINLYIDKGAVIIAAPYDDSTGYDLPEPEKNKFQDFGHSHFHNSLIWGEKLHDVGIIGGGKIWGKALVRSMTPTLKEPNKAISLLSCSNVVLRDITIEHGGWFALLATGVDNMTIDNLLIDTDRDGMDIDCCQNVRISNCTVNSPQDDGICLKSSFALGYARSTKNVTISNCFVSGYLEGSLLDGTYQPDQRPAPIGRIKMGTESNGGFQNISISNCVFDHCRGLALESSDGALLEDVVINNITMRDVTNSPLFVRLNRRMRGPDSLQIGACRRILISNVNVYNARVDSTASIISGIPDHEIEDLELSNIHIYYKGGGTKKMAETQVPEFEINYPEPYRFGVIPAYGFFIRHVKNLILKDIHVSFQQPDERSPFILDDVKTAHLQGIRAKRKESVPVFVLKEVTGLKIIDCEGVKDSSKE